MRNTLYAAQQQSTAIPPAPKSCFSFKAWAPWPYKGITDDLSVGWPDCWGLDIIVIAHRRVTLECILDSVHFPWFPGLRLVPGRAFFSPCNGAYLYDVLHFLTTEYSSVITKVYLSYSRNLRRCFSHYEGIFIYHTQYVATEEKRHFWGQGTSPKRMSSKHCRPHRRHSGHACPNNGRLRENEREPVREGG